MLGVPRHFWPSCASSARNLQHRPRRQDEPEARMHVRINGPSPSPGLSDLREREREMPKKRQATGQQRMRGGRDKRIRSCDPPRRPLRNTSRPPREKRPPNNRLGPRMADLGSSRRAVPKVRVLAQIGAERAHTLQPKIRAQALGHRPSFRPVGQNTSRECNAHFPRPRLILDGSAAVSRARLHKPWPLSIAQAQISTRLLDAMRLRG